MQSMNMLAVLSSSLSSELPELPDMRRELIDEFVMEPRELSDASLTMLRLWCATMR